MNELPRRKQIRLKNYDYSQNGYYYITICTKDKKPLFWNPLIVGAAICRPNLSKTGEIALTAIKAIPLHYSDISLDKYVIMPDHIHMILIINRNKTGRQIAAPTAPSLMTVIGQMKRWVSKEIGYTIWQKSYYEHIIRDKKDYLQKAEYIENNPLKLIDQKLKEF